METQATDAIKLNLNDTLKITIAPLTWITQNDACDGVNFSSQCEPQPWGDGLGAEGSGIPQPTCLHLLRWAAGSVHRLVQPQGTVVNSTLADR